MFRGSMKITGYPLHSPVSPSLPLPCFTVCHHISTGLYLQNPTSLPDLFVAYLATLPVSHAAQRQVVGSRMNCKIMRQTSWTNLNYYRRNGALKYLRQLWNNRHIGHGNFPWDCPVWLEMRIASGSVMLTHHTRPMYTMEHDSNTAIITVELRDHPVITSRRRVNQLSRRKTAFLRQPSRQMW
jgi:hypothetical protein